MNHASLSPETRREGGKARRSSAFLSQPVLSEKPADVAPTFLSRLSLPRRRRPYVQRPIWPPAKAVIFKVWPIIGIAAADRSVTPRLLSADRRCHLMSFSACSVKVRGAELLRRIPHCPGCARLPVFAKRQAAALILASLIRWPRLWKEKTEVESKSAHCQRPGLILPRFRVNNSR